MLVIHSLAMDEMDVINATIIAVDLATHLFLHEGFSGNMDERSTRSLQRESKLLWLLMYYNTTYFNMDFQVHDQSCRISYETPVVCTNNYLPSAISAAPPYVCPPCEDL